MADFPNSVKTFTSKTDGIDYVMAEHMNSVQNEVTAIEQTLLVEPYYINYPVHTDTVLVGQITGSYVTNFLPFNGAGSYEYDPSGRMQTGSSGFADYVVPISGSYVISMAGRLTLSAPDATENRLVFGFAINNDYDTVVYIVAYRTNINIQTISSDGTIVWGFNTGDRISAFVQCRTAPTVTAFTADIWRVG